MRFLIAVLSCVIGSLAWAETPDIVAQEAAGATPQVVVSCNPETLEPSRVPATWECAREISWNFIKDWKVSTLMVVDIICQAWWTKDTLSRLPKEGAKIKFGFIVGSLTTALTAGYAHWKKTQLDALKAGKVSLKESWYDKLAVGTLAIMLCLKAEASSKQVAKDSVLFNGVTFLVAVYRLGQLHTFSWLFSERKSLFT